LKQPIGQKSIPHIGISWHHKFIERNPQIKPIIVRGLDRARAAKMLKKEVFNDYFTLYKSLQEQYGIPAQDIYSMDEKGFAMALFNGLRF
jgi:hypothetical protein